MWKFSFRKRVHNITLQRTRDDTLRRGMVERVFEIKCLRLPAEMPRGAERERYVA
jgi:hypothetical protein